MKHIFGTALVGLCLTACTMSDDGTADPDFDALQTEDEAELEAIDDTLVADEDFDNAIEVNEEVIATILREGGDVTYYVDVDGPVAGEVTMNERFWPDEDGMLNVPDESLSPLETFLDLTDFSVPVPQALLDSEPDVAAQLATGRNTVTSLDEPVHATIGALTSEIRVQQWDTVVMCNQGGTSSMFANEICTIDSWWDQTYCHNGTWHGVTDYSSNFVNWTRGRTLACGANGRTRHWYKFGGIWYKKHTQHVPSGWLIYSTKTPITKLKRRVEHNRTGSGFVRGVSQFHRFPE